MNNLTVDYQIKGLHYLILSINITINSTFTEAISSEFFKKTCNENEIVNTGINRDGVIPTNKIFIPGSFNTLFQRNKLINKFTINEPYFQNFKIDIEHYDNNIKLIINRSFAERLMEWMLLNKCNLNIKNSLLSIKQSQSTVIETKATLSLYNDNNTTDEKLNFLKNELSSNNDSIVHSHHVKDYNISNNLPNKCFLEKPQKRYKNKKYDETFLDYENCSNVNLDNIDINLEIPTTKSNSEIKTKSKSNKKNNSVTFNCLQCQKM